MKPEVLKRVADELVHEVQLFVAGELFKVAARLDAKDAVIVALQARIVELESRLAVRRVA